MSTPIIVAALYQFTPLSYPEQLQKELKAVCHEQGIKGTLILASEGINGTVAGTRTAIDHLKSFLAHHFDALEYKESSAATMPFRRMKVPLKKEIVTIGDPSVSPIHLKGTYVDPQDWNALISDPDTLVLDTRNDYEVKIGTFRGAINPQTQTFSQFPTFAKTLPKAKKVAMFCTGGIRCEKASSYMLSEGFENVYHLKGGILKYLETVPPEENLWEGDCFVFDERVALATGLAKGQFERCFGCRHPISKEDKDSSFYERGISCPHCYHTLTDKKKLRARERQRQEDLAQQRGYSHLGDSQR